MTAPSFSLRKIVLSKSWQAQSLLHFKCELQCIFVSKDRGIWGKGKTFVLVSKINFNFDILFSFSGFHLKLPREVEPEEGSGSQGHKILSQPDEKPLQTSQSMQRSSQGQHVDDENMITQTPLDTLRDKQSLDVPPSHISDTGR